MAYDKSSLDDYVDVATRIAEFRAKYPDGYLAPLNPAQPFKVLAVGPDDKMFIAVVAAAYRQPGDTSPGVGMAWEPFPGRTPYTRDSELMNAETSAWGRAIIALGAADAKRGIRSLEEARNREEDEATRGSGWQPAANPSSRKAERSREPLADDPWATGPAQSPAENRPGTSTLQQQRAIAIRCNERGLTAREDKLAFCVEAGETGRPIASSKDLSYAEAAKILKMATT